MEQFNKLVGEHISPEFMDFLIYNGFFEAPASTKYHGNFEGGLYKHSRTVTEILVELTENNKLEWQHPRSPYIVGMFHDLCKIDSYRHPRAGSMLNGNELTDLSSWEYNTETLYKGHGEKSVLLLSQFMQLTPEEVACITYHMGAFTDKDEWNYYGRAVEQYPNVLWTHTADMIASRICNT